jgi:hypothetical protein
MITAPRLNIFLAAIVVITAITLIVFAAITAGTLSTLIFGVVVLGLISIGLATVGVNLFARYAEAQWKRDNLKLTHIERMADRGFLVSGRGVPTYLALQPPEIENDVPVGTSGVTNSTVDIYRDVAVELVALSKQIMPGKDKADQIATYRKAKAGHEMFRGGEGFTTWQHACQYLLIKQYCKEKFDEATGKKKLGTFVISGTVGQLYEKIRTH